MRLFRECDDGTLAAKVDHLQNLLCSLINGMEVAFICLGALDECSLSTKRESLSFIDMVIKRCDNVKVMVSSRSGDSEVSESFYGCLSITMTPQAVAQDIDLYFRRRIDRGPKRLRQARSEYMVGRLKPGAEGMYEQDFQRMCQPNSLIMTGFSGFRIRWISFPLSTRLPVFIMLSHLYREEFQEYTIRYWTASCLLKMSLSLQERYDG